MIGTSRYFTVSFCGSDSAPLMREVDAFRRAVRRSKADQPFHIRAMVILPDHLHAIWTFPKGDDDHDGRWSTVLSRFGEAAGQPRLGQRARVQAHEILSEDEKRRLTQMCWMDPVRHGLVHDPFDWPHSSIHRDAPRGEPMEASLGLGIAPDANMQTASADAACPIM